MLLNNGTLALIGLLCACAATASLAAPPADQPVDVKALSELQQLSSRAESRMAEGDYAEAVALCRQAKREAARLYGPDDWRTFDATCAEDAARAVMDMTPDERNVWRRIGELNGICSRLQELDSIGPALATQKELSVLVKQLFGPDSLAYALMQRQLGDLHLRNSEWREAKAAYREALANLDSCGVDAHPEHLMTLRPLAIACSRLGEAEEAYKLYEAYYAVFTKVHDKDSSPNPQVHEEAAAAAFNAEQYERSEFYCRRLLEEVRGPSGPSDQYLRCLYMLDRVLRNQGKYDDAVRVQQDMHAELERRGNAAGHTTVVRMACSFGDYFAELEDIAQAAEYYSKALNSEPDMRTHDRGTWLFIMEGAIRNALDRGDLETARHQLDELTSDMAENGEISQSEPFWLAVRTARMYRLAGNIESCAKSIQSAEELSRKLDLSRGARAKLLWEQGQLASMRGDHLKGKTLLEEAIETYSTCFGESNLFLASCEEQLARVIEKGGDSEIAEFHLRRALTIREKAVGKQHPTYANGLVVAARFYARQSQPQQATSLLDRAVEIYERGYADRPSQLAAKLGACAEVSDSLGNKRTSAKLQARATELTQEPVEPSHLAR